MNFYAITGTILSIGVLFAGLRMASSNFGLFIDYPSLFIVLGGTIAASGMSFQINRLIEIIKIFISKFFKEKREDSKAVILEIINIADRSNKGEKLSNLIEEIKDPFFKEALILVNDKVIQKDEILHVLKMRNFNLIKSYIGDANKIKTIGKYPPAFGMIGTTMGMIVLLANLGGADAMKMIGPAMGVCLITTFYGTVISNLVFNPISDNLTDAAKELKLKNEIIIEGVFCILDGKNPIVVAERVNSFMTPSKRIDWKTVLAA